MYKGISCNTHSAVWNDSLVQAAMITYHQPHIFRERFLLQLSMLIVISY